MHPILRVALGDSDEVIARVPVAAGSALDGTTLAEAQLELETGFYLLAIRRAGRYFYRPRGNVRLDAGDELIGIGPDEGQAKLAELCGYRDAGGRRHRRDRARPCVHRTSRTRPSMTAPAVTSDLGLSPDEVHERVEQGQTNDAGDRTSRTYARDHPRQRLHALQRDPRRDARRHPGGRADPGRDCSASSSWRTPLIGIIQEIRAKRTLDRLAVLSAPKARVVRAGEVSRDRRRGGRPRRPPRAADRRPGARRRRGPHRGRPRDRRVAADR